MATLSQYKKLIQFSRDTKELNPNLYSDIKKRFIKPCKSLEKAINRHYDSCESWQEGYNQAKKELSGTP